MLPRFPDPVSEKAQLALNTILQKPTKWIPSWLLNPMQHSHIELIAGVEPGCYKQDTEKVYLAMPRALGTLLLDQWIPLNPLTMGDAGYEQGTSLKSAHSQQSQHGLGSSFFLSLITGCGRLYLFLGMSRSRRL
jgi:hypothetical protein